MFRRATLFFAIVSLTAVGSSLAGHFPHCHCIRPGDSATGFSYIMPSIAPAEGVNEFYVTYLKAADYDRFFFAGKGNIFGGTMTIAGDTAQWVEEPVQLNGDDNAVTIGFGGASPWLNFMKPARRGDFVAWSQSHEKNIHYYDFGDGLAGSDALVPGQEGRWSRQINPRVTENGAIGYWARSAGGGGHFGFAQPWTLRVYDTELDRTIEVGEPTDGWNWANFASVARIGDVVSAEPGSGRVVYTKFAYDQKKLWFGFQVYSSEFAFGAAEDGSEDSITEAVPIQGMPADHGPALISSVKASGDFLVWQRGSVFHKDYTVQVAQWNDDEGSYEYLGELPEKARAQEPGLFGSYLVYAHREFDDQHDLVGTSIKMVDLADGVDAVPDLLVEVDPDFDIQWPAAWVDQETGDYVVLYQQMASPASLMMVTSIPEPGTLLLLATGSLILLACAWRKRRWR